MNGNRRLSFHLQIFPTPDSFSNPKADSPRFFPRPSLLTATRQISTPQQDSTTAGKLNSTNAL